MSASSSPSALSTPPAPRTPRTPRAPRAPRTRRNTREALLEAAVDLMAEGGARAVTHRAVAARAGVSPASTTYYFRSIQELTDEALAGHVAARARELAAMIGAAVDAGGTPLDISVRAANAVADRPERDVMAQLETYLDAWRNPDLRTSVAEAIETFEAVATEALRTFGVADPEAAAPAFVALIDGFAVHRLARPRPRHEERASLRLALQALFVALSMDDEQRRGFEERLTRPPAQAG